MEYLDLLTLLNVFGSKGLTGCQVHGIITKVVEKPSNLSENMKLSPNGIFVEMDVFAVGLKNYESYLRQCGYYNNNNSIYMVNGKIVTYIDQREINKVDWFTVNCTLRIGTKPQNTNYVVGFNFYKEGNMWVMPTCKCTDIDLSVWNHSSEAYNQIIASSREGRVVRLDKVSNLKPFTSILMQKTEYTPAKTEPTSESVTESTPQYKRKEGVSSGFKKENRRVIKPYSNLVAEFEDLLKNAKANRESFISNFCDDLGSGSGMDYIEYCVRGIESNFKVKPHVSSMTGQAIIKKYLSNFKSSSADYLGTTAGKYLISLFDEVAEFILDHNTTITADRVAWELCKTAFGDAEYFYAGVVSIITGISLDSMQAVYNVCKSNKLSFAKLVNENPYLLQFISDLSFNDIEKIALYFNRHLDKSLDKYRNIAMLNNYITGKSKGDTIFSRRDLALAPIGITLTKDRYTRMKQTGSYLTDGVYFNIISYLKESSLSDLGYTSQYFKQVGYSYIRAIATDEINTAIEDYTESGVGVLYNNYITSTDLLEKELFVYKAMYELGSTVSDYDTSLIDTYIAEYEDIVGFKLEKEQREAVYLCVNHGFIVAGSAGSGKTTVSNCIVYVLKKLNSRLVFDFIAPTGKAAKHMQEVVKQEAKTINSRFKIGQSGNNLLEVSFNEDSVSTNIAFFCDEGAMITIDLLYSALKRVDIKTCRFVLFGDFNQLPPIGKGLPFRNLLRFMPCVFLTVSKRAEEGSMITANSNYINDYSEPHNWKPLKSEKDFFLVDCAEEQIQNIVYSLCAYYLGKQVDENRLKQWLGVSDLPKVAGLSQDDIQVVTPLQKESYSWGASKLNTLLKPLFNPNRSPVNTFVHYVTDKSAGIHYSIGDRVIHTNKNVYSMQWYSDFTGDTVTKIYGNGICNGEVGKVVGFIASTDCTIYSEREPKPDNFNYPDNMRDDDTWYGDDKYFLVVSYWDYINEREIFILYRVEENTFVSCNSGKPVKGDDLLMLSHFYAGTTHKEQGSQAKIVICPLSSINYSGFITRQMVYTMFTRGQKLVFAVGSVSNSPQSMLSRARKDIASLNTLTIGELLGN